MVAQTNRIALLQKAEDAARKGEYDEALGIVSRCLDLYPGFSPARVLKSEILSRTGSPEGAIAELRDIIASNPENIRARMILTELLIQQKDQKQAMIHLEFLSFMVPENDPGLMDLRRRAEELQSVHPDEEETPQTLEFGIIEENEAEDVELLADNEEETEEPALILEDEVTEIFREEDLKAENIQGSPSTDSKAEPDVKEDALNLNQEGQIPAPPLEELDESEEVRESEVITVHVPEEEREEETPVESEVEIKTLTMARVYERQKMYDEALNILEEMQENNPSEELAAEVERIKKLSESRTISESGNHRQRVVVSLRDWMEKIVCNSKK